jgi:gas vesicle protein
MEIRKRSQDAAYVTVGVGVLAFQQAQVRRREAQADFETQAKKARATFERTAQDVRSTVETAAKDARAKAEAFGSEARDRVEPFIGDVKERVEPLVEQLQGVPAQVKQAVEAGATRARELVGRAA